MKANEHLANVAPASPSSAGELSLDTYHAALQALRRDEIFTVGAIFIFMASGSSVVWSCESSTTRPRRKRASCSGKRT